MQRVIFVGDPCHHEFCDAVAWLREYCELTVCDSLASAGRLAHSPGPPSAIVLGQSRPGVITQFEIERLRSQSWPARLIVALGGWCEGELRTGKPLHGVTRVYWHRFIPQVGPSLQRGRAWEQSLGTPDAKPLESTPTCPAPAYRAASGLVLVRSGTREAYEALSDACNAIGHSTVWVPHPRSVLTTQAKHGVWDCPGDLDEHGDELAEFACQLHPAPVVAVLGFPRGDDCDAALAHGAAAVISKPYLQSELWTAMAHPTNLLRQVA